MTLFAIPTDQTLRQTIDDASLLTASLALLLAIVYAAALRLRDRPRFRVVSDGDRFRVQRRRWICWSFACVWTDDETPTGRRGDPLSFDQLPHAVDYVRTTQRAERRDADRRRRRWQTVATIDDDGVTAGQHD